MSGIVYETSADIKKLPKSKKEALMRAQEAIPFEQIEFDPFIADVVQGMIAAAKRHHPDSIVAFVDCGGCPNLHALFCADRQGGSSIPLLTVPPAMWKRIIQQ